MNKQGYVFVNGYGLCKFKSEAVWNFMENNKSTLQFQGKIKLPKGVRLGTGEKWKELNYYFTEEQIFKTEYDAIYKLLINTKHCHE